MANKAALVGNTVNTATDLLDQAFYADPGEKLILRFVSSQERDRFRNRLTAEVMRSIKRNCKLAPQEAAYGESDWPGVHILKDGDLGLVLCRGLGAEVVVYRELPDGSRVKLETQPDEGDEKKP